MLKPKNNKTSNCTWTTSNPRKKGIKRKFWINLSKKGNIKGQLFSFEITPKNLPSKLSDNCLALLARLKTLLWRTDTRWLDLNIFLKLHKRETSSMDIPSTVRLCKLNFMNPNWLSSSSLRSCLIRKVFLSTKCRKTSIRYKTWTLTNNKIIQLQYQTWCNKILWWSGTWRNKLFKIINRFSIEAEAVISKIIISSNGRMETSTIDLTRITILEVVITIISVSNSPISETIRVKTSMGSRFHPTWCNTTTKLSSIQGCHSRNNFRSSTRIKTCRARWKLNSNKYSKWRSSRPKWWSKWSSWSSKKEVLLKIRKSDLIKRLLTLVQYTLKYP